MDLIKCANCNQTILISIPHEKKYCAVSKCAFHEKKKDTTGADINSEGFQSCKYELVLNVVIQTYLQMKDTSATIPVSLF